MENKPIEKYKLELKELPALASKPYTKITCPSCQKDLPADNLNINDKIAKCGHCHVVFPFHKELTSFTKNQQDKTIKQELKQEVIRPEGIDISHFRNELDIAIQQPGGWGWVLFFFVCVALCVTLVFFTKGANMSILAPALTWLSTLYPLINLINHSKHKVYLNIDDHFISIKWRPKYFIKDKSFAVQDIEQVYVKKMPDTGYYNVYMIVNSFKGQKHVQLIQMISSLSKAQYLEQEIERHLGITDRVVREEVV